jgi:hypothetical protein
VQPSLHDRGCAEKENSMRYRKLTGPSAWMIPATAGLILGTLAALPSPLSAAPCTGTTRLQLRWSASTGAALLSFSATQCDRPPRCSESAARTAGSMFTQSPITLTVKDAAGHSFSEKLDAGSADCGGRCERVNRGGCLGGADVHRMAGSFVRYVVNTLGQTTVVANKLRIPMSERPDLVTPVVVTITDAAGYAVTAELHKCRVRGSGGAARVACS